jgi:hypothetical protein
VVVLELRVPVGSATSRRQIQHQPKRVEVWSTARVLAGIGHRSAQFAAVVMVSLAVASGEDAKAGYVSVVRIDIRAGLVAGHIGDKGEIREATQFLEVQQPIDGRAGRNGDC